MFTASEEASAANVGEALLDALRSFLFGELKRRIIETGGLPEVADGHEMPGEMYWTGRIAV